jgi:ABC-type Fe3+/spermidine/putrescine transport system ATPase subunit
MEVHIRLRNLSKRFGDTLAVDDLNLEVEKGSFITLLGPSGCGKTTTLRLIAGFNDPDQGEIYLGDKLLNKIPAHRRGVAMVFQSYALFPHMNVFNNVAYGLKLRKMSKHEIRKKVKEVLSLLDMEGMEKRWPGQLSGGQQQRIAVARALALEPEALLMDEPLSNLDAKLRISVRNEIKELQRRLRITTIYVTHDQEEALSMSDKVAVMKNGRLQQVAAPWEIYNHPVNQFVADFIGAANFLEGTIVNLGSNKIEFVVDNQRFVMQNQSYNLMPGQKILVNVRPESIKISKIKPEDNVEQLDKGSHQQI